MKEPTTTDGERTKQKLALLSYIRIFVATFEFHGMTNRNMHGVYMQLRTMYVSDGDIAIVTNGISRTHPDKLIDWMKHKMRVTFSHFDATNRLNTMDRIQCFELSMPEF